MEHSISKPGFWRRQTTIAAAVYLAIWGACVAVLAVGGGNFLFPVSSLVLFGVILSGLAIILTRKADAPPVQVARPQRETLLLLVYVAFYALVLFGPVSTMVRQAFAEGPARQAAVLVYKLVVHVVLPAILIYLARGHLRGIFDHGLRRRGVLLTMIVFSAVMILAVALLNSTFDQLHGRGLSILAIAGWLLLAWVWLSVEAGVCEEFLFRGLLQSRLTAWMSSPPMAIVATAIIFALVHVPSFYLRGGEAVSQQASTIPQLLALSIAALGPIAILLGILWHRTRSFLLVVVVHGAIDATPAVEKMIRIWS